MGLYDSLPMHLILVLAAKYQQYKNVLAGGSVAIADETTN